MTTDISNLPTWVILAAISLGLWSIVWKGFALYKAGRLQQPLWFTVLLIVNTAGILEILYIFVFSKTTNATRKSKKNSKGDAHTETESHIIKSID